jgi:hypothetical protein
MKKTFSLSALALIATALILPMQAQAADRQISVKQKKFPTFTVDDSSQLDSANTNTDIAEAKPPKIGVKEFRVNDEEVKPQPATVDDQDIAQEESAPTPKKKKTLRFKVQDQPEQALSTPAQDEADDVAEAPAEQPSNLLNEKVKLVKKPRVESNDEQEDAAAPVDDTSEDVAADTTDTEEATDPNELRYYKLKKKHYAVQYQTEESYQPTTYNYQEPSDSGYSCHNNNGY